MTFEKKMPTMNTKNLKDYNMNKQQNNQSNDENIQEIKENNQQNIDINNLEQQITEITQKNKNLEEKLLYLAAELQNTKRINTIELENANKYAINKFAIDAVSIYDTLQTAIEHTQIDEANKQFYDGIKMTISEFEKMFERIQIKKIDPEIGTLFDHNKHQAISRITSDLAAGCITKVIRVGYEIYDRLLRPAMVVVSSGK